jgi:hypothetical protein
MRRNNERRYQEERREQRELYYTTVGSRTLRTATDERPRLLAMLFEESARQGTRSQVRAQSGPIQGSGQAQSSGPAQQGRQAQSSGLMQQGLHQGGHGNQNADGDWEAPFDYHNVQSEDE